MLPRYMRKGMAVWLREDLPPRFGNTRTIVAHPAGHTQTKGYVVSNGFEGGVLKVRFVLADCSEITTQLYEFGAERYLECDPFAFLSGHS